MLILALVRLFVTVRRTRTRGVLLRFVLLDVEPRKRADEDNTGSGLRIIETWPWEPT